MGRSWSRLASEVGSAVSEWYVDRYESATPNHNNNNSNNNDDDDDDEGDTVTECVEVMMMMTMRAIPLRNASR